MAVRLGVLPGWANVAGVLGDIEYVGGCAGVRFVGTPNAFGTCAKHRGGRYDVRVPQRSGNRGGSELDPRLDLPGADRDSVPVGAETKPSARGIDEGMAVA
ncbi:hypothetical protein GCM10027167_35480 [Nocardia heshunensis]